MTRHINLEDFWCIYTVHPEYDFMAMYFFKWDQTKNEMCTQTTKSDEIAREMFINILKSYHNLGDNKFLSKDGLLLDYTWKQDSKYHQFMYYNPTGKKPFIK